MVSEVVCIFVRGHLWFLKDVRGLSKSTVKGTSIIGLNWHVKIVLASPFSWHSQNSLLTEFDIYFRFRMWKYSIINMYVIPCNKYINVKSWHLVKLRRREKFPRPSHFNYVSEILYTWILFILPLSLYWISWCQFDLDFAKKCCTLARLFYWPLFWDRGVATYYRFAEFFHQKSLSFFLTDLSDILKYKPSHPWISTDIQLLIFEFHYIYQVRTF